MSEKRLEINTNPFPHVAAKEYLAQPPEAPLCIHGSPLVVSNSIKCKPSLSIMFAQ
jgi:hypothetical protein